jgi:hypothetical protein
MGLYSLNASFSIPITRSKSDGWNLRIEYTQQLPAHGFWMRNKFMARKNN